MDFAAALGRARRVEVAKGGGAQTVRGLVPRKRALEGELRLAVRVGRLQGVGLFDGLLLGLAVDGRSRREDEARYIALPHRVQEREPRDDVVSIILRGVCHRLADERIGGHVYDGLASLPAQRLAHARAV